MLSVPIIARITCADFRCALGRFVGCTYRPRLLPGTAGWRAYGHLMPVRRRISPLPYSAVQTFRSPYAGGFLGAVIPSSSPRPWPSPHSERARLPLVPAQTAGSVTTLQDSIDATDRLLARPPKGLCRDASTLRISPRAGHQLHGCLVTTVAGLPPASRIQLPRTHPRVATSHSGFLPTQPHD